MKKLALALLFLSWPAWAISVVQTTSGEATATSVGKAFVSNVTGGNAIVVGCRGANAPSPDFTVSDTQSNSYTKIFTQDGTQTNLHNVAFVAFNVAAGATTVTCTSSPSSSETMAIMILEVSGIATIDQSAGGANTSSTAISTSNVTTTNPNEIVIVFIDDPQNSTITAGSGYTKDGDTSTHMASWEHQITTSTGTFGASLATWAAATAWSATLVTLAAPVSSGRKLITY